VGYIAELEDTYVLAGASTQRYLPYWPAEQAMLRIGLFVKSSKLLLNPSPSESVLDIPV
jgi:hypothetical protein